MPKGIQLKQNLPQGVMKVVRSLQPGSSLTCQKPELASSFENTLPWESCEIKSLILGKGKASLRTPLFKRVKSTHNPMSLFALGAIVRPEHEAVGSSTSLEVERELFLLIPLV